MQRYRGKARARPLTPGGGTATHMCFVGKPGLVENSFVFALRSPPSPKGVICALVLCRKIFAPAKTRCVSVFNTEAAGASLCDSAPLR